MSCGKTAFGGHTSLAPLFQQHHYTASQWWSWGSTPFRIGIFSNPLKYYHFTTQGCHNDVRSTFQTLVGCYLTEFPLPGIIMTVISSMSPFQRERSAVSTAIWRNQCGWKQTLQIGRNSSQPQTSLLPALSIHYAKVVVRFRVIFSYRFFFPLSCSSFLCCLLTTNDEANIFLPVSVISVSTHCSHACLYEVNNFNNGPTAIL